MRKQSLFRVDLPYAERRRNRADWGFAILGPLGKPAMPELIALLQHHDSGVRRTAARCLGHIGPEAEVAVPAILPLLSERNTGLPILAAMDALGEIHRMPEVVVPAMLAFLQGSRAEWNYASPAMSVLRAYGAQATSAVPAIEAYLVHADADKRNNALNALNQIDPEAAARHIARRLKMESHEPSPNDVRIVDAPNARSLGLLHPTGQAARPHYESGSQ